MQPIIRRTITITITETWTITWPDGHETRWEETHEAAYSADGEPDVSRPLIPADEEQNDGTPDSDAATPTVEAE